MMRRLFLLLFFCFCAGAADEWCAFTPYGFRVGPHSFTLTAWNNGWKGSILSAKTTQADPGFPKKTADGIEYRGIYHLPLRSFRLSVTGKQTSADAAEYRMTFSADPALRMDGIAFGCVIRRELWDRQPYQIDGRKVVLKKGEKTRNLGSVRRIQFPTREGVVVLEGTFQATLHDLSHTSYAPDSLNLRLNPVPQNGMIRQTGFAFQFRRRAFDAETLDLRSAMNMGFRDEQPNDRKGGWTDQGGTNDLSAMTPGKKICANVPFQVVDPETNRGKSCIVLRGADRLYFPVRAEKKFLDTLAMDETGNWHKLDPWTLYQLPREAFLGPARLKLLDSMYSVKGETHNPKIYVLPSELRSGDITGESRPERGAVPYRQAVKNTDGLRIQQCHDSTKEPPRDRERKRQLDEAIRRALLKDAPAEVTRERRSVAALDEIDQIPDEPKERKGVLDEEFI